MFWIFIAYVKARVCNNGERERDRETERETEGQRQRDRDRQRQTDKYKPLQTKYKVVSKFY